MRYGRGAPRIEIGQQGVVGRLAHERDQFFTERVNDSLGAAKRFRRFGAPPVESLATLTPISTVPLSDGGPNVSECVNFVFATQRELPADFGLEGDIALVIVHREEVEGAARSPMKIRAVQEDARVFYEPSRGFSIFVSFNDAVFPLGLELPLVVGETLGRLHDSLDILFVNEVRTVAATTLSEIGGVAIENPLATVVEDAGPVTF